MNSLKQNPGLFAGIGLLLVIIGIGIITIHGNPLRGSGLGTISIIAGIILVGLVLRARMK
jgi:hypothetical protein